MHDVPRGVADGALLRLLDGEVLPGRPGGTVAGAADTLAWRHAWLGTLHVPLDAVAGISAPPFNTAGTHDVVTLKDGDEVSGFCVQVGATVQVEDDRGTLHELPFNDIASIRLATPAPAAPVGCSSFMDGSVVRLRGFRMDGDGSIHHAPHPLASTPGLGAGVTTPHVLAVGEQVVPLAAVHIAPADTSTLAPEVIDATRSMRIGPVRLRGKGRWKLDVPSGMHHLRATIRVPDHLRHLAGGTLLVVVDEAPVAMIDLDEMHEARLDIPVDGGKVVRLERATGAHGEVGATVDLLDGVLVGPIRPRSTP